MLAARGKPVLYLKRLSMGPLELDPELVTGGWRPLTEEEPEEIEGIGIISMCTPSAFSQKNTFSLLKREKKTSIIEKPGLKRTAVLRD